MGQAAWPAAAQVVALLARAGYTVASTEAGYAAEAARDEFERRTGMEVIAAVAPGRTRRYDPPADGWLDLRRDCSSVTQVAYHPEGGAEEILAAGEEYWTEPYSGAGDPEPLAEPVRSIRFRRRWPRPLHPSDRRSLKVTGLWGYGTTVPDDIFQAALHRAGARLLPEAAELLAAGRVSRDEAGVATVWGSGRARALREAWDAEFEAAVRRWRRGWL